MVTILILEGKLQCSLVYMSTNSCTKAYSKAIIIRFKQNMMFLAYKLVFFSKTSD